MVALLCVPGDWVRYVGEYIASLIVSVKSTFYHFDKAFRIISFCCRLFPKLHNKDCDSDTGMQADQGYLGSHSSWAYRLILDNIMIVTH